VHCRERTAKWASLMVAFVSMRACKVCTHPERAKIEDHILRHEPHQKIGDWSGLSLHSVWRHSKHLGRSLVVKGDLPLVGRVEGLLSRLERISEAAQTAKNWSAATSALREVRCSLELIAKLTGQIVPAGAGVSVGVAVNVTTGRSASDLSNRDLDTQIAVDVAEATDNFDPQAIERLRRLAQRNRPALTMEQSETPARELHS
jgi:hypothetical protein